MEEEVWVEAAGPIQEEAASILQAVEASPGEEEASCPEEEELHPVHEALEEILQAAWAVHLLPWREAEEEAWAASGESRAVQAAWEAFHRAEAPEEEACRETRGDRPVVRPSCREAAARERSPRWGWAARPRTVDAVCPLAREGSVPREDAPRRTRVARPYCPS